MAFQQQVKPYLAYWFLVGNPVYLDNGQVVKQPESVLQRDRFSAEFEACWQEILSPESGYCYLQGTEQRIEELLSSDWEVEPCARYQMPIPHFPIDNQKHLSDISQRVNQTGNNIDAIRARLETTERCFPNFLRQKQGESFDHGQSQS